MVPIHPFRLYALSTLHNLQEIPHSLITPQVIPYIRESLSDTLYLDSFSQRFTNEDNTGSHKILVQNFKTQMIHEN